MRSKTYIYYVLVKLVKMSGTSKSYPHLPDVKTIGYILVFLRLLWKMDTLPSDSEPVPTGFFSFRYKRQHTFDYWYVMICGRCYEKPRNAKSNNTTENQIASMSVLQTLRQRALKAARKYQESQNLMMAAFETFLPFYADVNLIELYMRILQSSDLHCLKCSINPQAIAQISPLYYSYDFEKIMTDLMALIVLSPDTLKEYLTKLHQECKDDIGRRFRTIVNKCILDAFEFTTLNDFFLQNCGDLWRIVQKTS